MRRIVLPILLLLAVACSKEIDDVTLAENNEKVILAEAPDDTGKSAPFLEQRSFKISEHSAVGSSIGFLKATDADKNQITYALESETAIDIDEKTGELKVGAGLKLDFESVQNIDFTVSAFNGKTITEKTYSLAIQDVDETALLTVEDQELITYFQYLTLWKAPSHKPNDTNRKWDNEMKLNLAGTITDEFRASVERVIAQYNPLFSAGDFRISLTENSEQANAHLFFGTTEEVEAVWPDMYEIIKDGRYDGYAKTPSQSGIISSTRIWLSNPLEALFKHEVGHALGFGHTNKCGDEKSFLCSRIGSTSDILPIEEEVIRYLYHSDMNADLSETEMEKVLANFILNEE